MTPSLHRPKYRRAVDLSGFQAKYIFTVTSLVNLSLIHFFVSKRASTLMISDVNLNDLCFQLVVPVDTSQVIRARADELGSSLSLSFARLSMGGSVRILLSELGGDMMKTGSISLEL